MKFGRPCSKCGGKQFLYSPGGKLDNQNSAQVNRFLMPYVIRIARYICSECGFVEEWVDRESDMETVKSLAAEGG